jgi:thiamine pyrophosphate-dependent acetolactate synthase large subunit-like protein
MATSLRKEFNEMVLTKEEFLSKIKERIGENPTDEDISFVEDMTDTIDSLTQVDDWQKKYEENDARWRKKYTERFFTPDKESEKETEKESEEKIDEEEITIDDLFESELK